MVAFLNSRKPKNLQKGFKIYQHIRQHMIPCTPCTLNEVYYEVVSDLFLYKWLGKRTRHDAPDTNSGNLPCYKTYLKSSPSKKSNVTGWFVIENHTRNRWMMHKQRS